MKGDVSLSLAVNRVVEGDSTVEQAARAFNVPESELRLAVEHDERVLERRVIDAAIRCFYTDGSDGSEDGPYMRGLYRDLRAAVDALMKQRQKEIHQQTCEGETAGEPPRGERHPALTPLIRLRRKDRDMEEKQSVNEGWQAEKRYDQRVYHYIVNTFSLCGKLGFYTGDLMPHTGKKGREDCSQCFKRVEKRAAEAQTAV